MPRKSTQTMTVETEVEKPSSTEAIKVAVITNDIKHLGEAMNRLEVKFDQAILGFVTHEKLRDVQKAADEKHKQQDKAIASLEDWNKWAVRIVLGLVISAVVGLAFSSKL